MNTWRSLCWWTDLSDCLATSSISQGRPQQKTADHNSWDDGEAWREDLGWQSKDVVWGDTGDRLVQVDEVLSPFLFLICVNIRVNNLTWLTFYWCWLSIMLLQIMLASFCMQTELLLIFLLYVCWCWVIHKVKNHNFHLCIWSTTYARCLLLIWPQ